MKVTESFRHQEVLGLKFGYAPIGKPSLYVHVYFVDGLLIDTGQAKMGRYVVDSTKDLPVDQIFITHHHEDHSGNIKLLQETYGCPVYAPAMTCEMMKNPPKISLAQKLVWGERPAFHSLTAEDKVIETASFRFELIPIPGHAVDMVALYEPDKKWLFSADLFINTYIGYFLAGESMQQQIQSTQNVLKLDFDTMFCAHNPQLVNGKQRLTKKLHFLEDFFSKVQTLHAKGCSEKEIFKRLKLKENHFVKFLSGGQLSKMNMIRSVVNDLESSRP